MEYWLVVAMLLIMWLVRLLIKAINTPTTTHYSLLTTNY